MELNWHGLYRYDAWANDATLSSIRDQGDAGDEARRLFAHILAAQRNWLSRLLGEPKAVDGWPSWTLTQMTKHAHDLPAQWSAFITDAADHFDKPCVYRNSEGERFETPIDQILMHVIVHSGYHRGQVAIALRTVGLVAAVTDFIAFARR